MKKNYTLKITLAMLFVVLVSLVSFVGVYKGKNLVKDYSLGKDFKERKVAVFSVKEQTNSENTTDKNTESETENNDESTKEENGTEEKKTEETNTEKTKTEENKTEGNKTEEFDGTLSARGARKAAGFVKFCDAFEIPVLTLTNVTGFNATVCSEKVMAKAVGELVHAFASATVPKVNVIIGKAYGTAYVAMNSKSVGADFVYAWENAEIGMMDASMAAKIMYPGSEASVLNEKAAEYRALQSNVESAAARGYVDTVIAPADTRKYVIGAFEMLFTKREDRPAKKHGTV